MSDGNFFQTEKRGEVPELRNALHDSSKSKRKDALKKIIASMTTGKDVSSLFPDVVNCMQTNNIELKKLVYLYVINYSRAQPELAILAINTFRKDSQDPNPLIRGLAIRTMGCIRLDQVTEYLMEPLRRCCKEQDPYVRKTASMCIAKLYDVSPQMVEEQGFISLLTEMISDDNPMVVANSVAALAEISEVASKNYLKDFINASEENVSKLLSALNECTEWSQVFILDALALYEPNSPRDAESVLERITARLSHANSAVVLSAVKMVMKLLNHIIDEDVIKSTQRKLSPPLITLLSSEPEIQYVALRNMNLIIQKRPLILAADVKMFFCNYNDPIYVKMEKIDIMVRLCSPRNIDQVLMEFKEYATEVDVDFVRTSVRGIGRCAIKIEAAAEKCISVLLELIESRINYVVQEAIVVIKDIFRKYPNRYEVIISDLCENLDSLDEPEAKGSMIWILGEYARRIDNANELLEEFMNNFHDETPSVQLQILTAIVKLFLLKPSSTQDLVTRILKMCTDECNNPDIRDRAYIYWRLLSRNPEEARKVVLCEKPTINSDAYSLDIKLLDKLIENISMLASIYHKPPDSFTLRQKHEQEDEEDSEIDDDDLIERAKIQIEGNNSEKIDNDDDLIDKQDVTSDRSSDEPGDDSSDEIYSSDTHEKKNFEFSDIPKVISLPSTKIGKNEKSGLEVKTALIRSKGSIYLLLTLTNTTSSNLSDFKINFNINSFGLDSADTFNVPTLMPKESYETKLKMEPNVKNSGKAPTEPLVLHTAIKCNLDIFYFSILFDISIIYTESPPLEKTKFKSIWQEYKTSDQPKKTLTFLAKSTDIYTQSSLTQFMQKINCSLVANRSEPTFEAYYFSTLTTVDLWFLFEIAVQKGTNLLKIEIGGPPTMLRLAASSLIKSLSLSPNK